MLKLRKAFAEDIPLILSFIRELAEYERAPNAVSCTEKDLHRDGFGPSPKFREGWRIMQLMGRELNELAESSSTRVSKDQHRGRARAKQQASH